MQNNNENAQGISSSKDKAIWEVMSKIKINPICNKYMYSKIKQQL